MDEHPLLESWPKMERKFLGTEEDLSHDEERLEQVITLKSKEDKQGYIQNLELKEEQFGGTLGLKISSEISCIKKEDDSENLNESNMFLNKKD